MILKGKYPIDKFKNLQTPFYYYDLDLLRETLKTVNEITEGRITRSTV